MPEMNLKKMENNKSKLKKNEITKKVCFSWKKSVIL